jgi:hypothetical protein
MAELQSQVKSCIDCTDVFFVSSPEVHINEIDQFLSSTYRRFLKYAWHDLPVSSAEGSALATVSCMPLWELLNEYTNTCGPLAESKRGFAVQTLTAMYPKSKDRRCVFQQLNCSGSNPQTAVPLSTHIPLEMSVPEIPANSVWNEYVTALQGLSRISRLGSYTDGKETSTVSALLRSLVTVLLPKCVLVDAASPQAATSSSVINILLRDSGTEWNSGFFFLRGIWNALSIGEYLNLPETKELVSFLRSSRWSSQVVSFSGQNVPYARILSPLADICSLCISLSLRTPSTSVDTVPLIDPRVVELLCGSGIKVLPSSCAETFANTYLQDEVLERKTSLVEQKTEHVAEQLNETIPSEIDLMGFSPSCRDFDQLAYLCRDLLFLPSLESSESKEKRQRRNRDLLFNRKRGRGGSSVDGPCFIPVKSGLSDLMEKSSTESQVTLERLCCKWSKD